jgi:hypothetical protein
MSVENYKKYLFDRDRGNKLIWTIEHIFPEGERIPKAWVDVIANGDEKKAKELQREYVHKLGNLTITGYNSNLSNKPFIEKRDRTKINESNKEINIGYNNGLHLNEYIYYCDKLANKLRDIWQVEDIQNRTKLIVDEAIKLYSIN